MNGTRGTKHHTKEDERLTNLTITYAVGLQEITSFFPVTELRLGLSGLLWCAAPYITAVP